MSIPRGLYSLAWEYHPSWTQWLKRNTLKKLQMQDSTLPGHIQSPKSSRPSLSSCKVSKPCLLCGFFLHQVREFSHPLPGQGRPPFLVCSAAIPNTRLDSLNYRNWSLIVLNSGKSKIKVWTDWVPDESSPPGLQSATFSLCPHMGLSSVVRASFLL